MTKFVYTCPCDHIEEQYKFCPLCGSNAEEVELIGVELILFNYEDAVKEYTEISRKCMNNIRKYREEYYEYHADNKDKMKCTCRYSCERNSRLCECERGDRNLELKKRSGIFEPIYCSYFFRR